jgi:hypothetical protein
MQGAPLADNGPNCRLFRIRDEIRTTKYRLAGRDSCFTPAQIRSSTLRG